MTFASRTSRILQGLAAALAATWILILFLASDTPKEELAGKLPGPSGNLLHIVAHAILAGLLVRAFVPAASPFDRRVWPGLRTPVGRWVLGLTALHGLSDEIHQFFVPGRTCSVLDLCLDTAGALLVLTLPLAGAPGRPASWRPFAVTAAGALLVGLLGTWSRPFPDRVLESVLRVLAA